MAGSSSIECAPDATATAATAERGIVADFSPHVMTLADKAYMASVTDEYLMRVIKKGGAAMGKMATMPAWEKRLSDEEVRSIVAHIREF